MLKDRAKIISTMVEQEETAADGFTSAAEAHVEAACTSDRDEAVSSPSTFAA